MSQTWLLMFTLLIVANSEVIYNWISLAKFTASEYRLQRPLDRKYYEKLCSRLSGLNPSQYQICVQNPSSIPFVAKGVREAIFECQQQFKYERWNCSDRMVAVETPNGPFYDILGRTIRSSTQESAYLTAVGSAAIVHAITKGCNTGNLSDCSCDNKPSAQHYIEQDAHGAVERQEHFSWGGCSDNVPYGVRFARKFLDEWEKKQFDITKNVSHLTKIHNHFVGREAVAQQVRKQCRCHGVSGSCELKTCWLQMPKFAEVADMLKKRYDHFAVQVEMDVTRKAKKRLRRKERGMRHIPLRGNEMVFMHRSPSFCDRNDTLGILGTSGRECKYGAINSQSCDLLCCGRGHNTQLERRKTQCSCKFVWCCEVKCKECIEDVQVHTCK